MSSLSSSAVAGPLAGSVSALGVTGHSVTGTGRSPLGSSLGTDGPSMRSPPKPAPTTLIISESIVPIDMSSRPRACCRSTICTSSSSPSGSWSPTAPCAACSVSLLGCGAGAGASSGSALKGITCSCGVTGAAATGTSWLLRARLPLASSSVFPSAGGLGVVGP